MIEISKEEIRKLLKNWGYNQLDDLENTLKRELTEDEFKELIMYSMGYADFSKAETLVSFIDFVNLTKYLSKEEIEAVKVVDESIKYS